MRWLILTAALAATPSSAAAQTERAGARLTLETWVERPAPPRARWHKLHLAPEWDPQDPVSSDADFPLIGGAIVLGRRGS